VHLIEAVWVLRINAYEAAHALRRRQDAVKSRRSNSVPLAETDRGELHADVRLKACSCLSSEKLTRIGSVAIGARASRGLAESVEGDGEAAALQVERDLNGAYISRATAEQVYGVVIASQSTPAAGTPVYSLDRAASEQRRKQLLSQKQPA
jgi:hypothetical protein